MFLFNNVLISASANFSDSGADLISQFMAVVDAVKVKNNVC